MNHCEPSLVAYQSKLTTTTIHEPLFAIIEAISFNLTALFVVNQQINHQQPPLARVISLNHQLMTIEPIIDGQPYSTSICREN